MTTNTSERDLERLICTALTGHACDPAAAGEVDDLSRYLVERHAGCEDGTAGR